MYEEHIRSMKTIQAHAVELLSVLDLLDNASVLGVQNMPVLVEGTSDDASVI